MRGLFPKPDNTQDPLLRSGDALARRAHFWLFWERYAPVLAIAALAAALFLAGAYVGLWQRIGDPWRLIALTVTLYFIVKAFIAARRKNIPTYAEAERRVERDSGVSHRPLQTLRDRAVLNHQAGGQTLWTQHQAKARDAAARLKPAKAVAVIAPRDKYFMRFVAPILLGLAIIVGIGDNVERLRSALSPSWQSPMDPAKVTFDAWVDPPDYTGRPPVYFKGQQTVDIPAGSELVARIQGIKDAPRLKLKRGGLFGTQYLSLKRLGPDSFEARTVLEKSASAEWRVGSKRRIWNLVVFPDTAPQVDWVVEPKADKRDRLSFQYSLKDDYGVVDLSLEMSLLEGEEASDSVVVPLTGKSVRETKGTDSVIDLTKHKWAGRKVSGRLIAADGTGETAESDLAYFTIPDKIFVEPIAKAVAEQRTLVMAGLASGQGYAPLPRRTLKEWENMPIFDDWQTDQKLGRAPQDIQRAASLIDAITDAPEGLYDDPAVFMGLRGVLGTLRHSREIEAIAPVPELLWGIAIRAEFGSLGTALEEMREAEANLSEGMARRAPQREIDTLFQRYDEAVERYIEELSENAEEVDAEGGSGGARNTDEIAELMKAIEEANRIGDTEGARRALKKLAELLENLKIQMAKGGQGEGGDPSSGEMSEEMKESLEDMADLLGEQRELKDETEKTEKQADNGAQNPQPGQGSKAGEQGAGEKGDSLSAKQLAERQGKIAELLDGVKNKLPEGIGPLDKPGDTTSGGDEAGQGQGSGNQGREEQGRGKQEDGAGSGDNPNENGTGGGGNDPDSENRGSGGPNAPLRSPDDALGEAGEAMKRAEDALKAGDLDGAARAQADAIEALREAGQGLAQQVRTERGESGQQAGQNNPLGQNGEEGEDGANDDLSRQDIDPRDNATRSRELLEELRRRAAEQEREQTEREYLERLLKRF